METQPKTQTEVTPELKATLPLIEQAETALSNLFESSRTVPGDSLLGLVSSPQSSNMGQVTIDPETQTVVVNVESSNKNYSPIDPDFLVWNPATPRDPKHPFWEYSTVPHSYLNSDELNDFYVKLTKELENFHKDGWYRTSNNYTSSDFKQYTPSVQPLPERLDLVKFIKKTLTTLTAHNIRTNTISLNGEGDDCETCGWNSDEMTATLITYGTKNEPLYVKLEGRWGCYGGHYGVYYPTETVLKYWSKLKKYHKKGTYDKFSETVVRPAYKLPVEHELDISSG